MSSRDSLPLLADSSEPDLAAASTRVTALRCVRCQRRYGLAEHRAGCPTCRADGVPAAVLAEYDRSGIDGPALWRCWQDRRPGLWSHRELLPVPADDAVTLAEGGTPLLPLPARMTAGPAAEAGSVLVKDERRNPTGSFKDRFFSTAVSWARQAGAHTVAIASSGNAGVSLAAYAAAAGLTAVVVATEDVGGAWRRLIELHGARLLLVESSARRWEVLAEGEREHGWTVLTNTSFPPVGSLWVGIEGYKTLAHEIVRDLGEPPETVIAPVSRGDGLAGAWRGFRELRELGVISQLPSMIAAERDGSLARALDAESEFPPEVEPAHTAASSMRSPQGTVMALRAIRDSGGIAVTSTEEGLREACADLASAGLAVELSAAAPLAAWRELRGRDALSAPSGAVLLATSDATHQPDALP